MSAALVMRCENLATRLRSLLSEALRARTTRWLLAFVIASILFFTIGSVRGQSSVPVYWRYDAPGRLNQILVGDVNEDGVDEFVVIAGGINVVVVASDGRARWPAPYQAQTPVLQLISANLDGPAQSPHEFVLTTETEAIALDSEGEELWRVALSGRPAALARYGPNPEAADEILLALEGGQLLRLDGAGEQTWQYTFTTPPAEDATPQVMVDDINRDGQQEIIFTYFTADGFSKLVVIGPDGERTWESSNNGSVTALAIAEFDPARPKEIALSTSLDRVHLYTAEGIRRWPYRSINKPITSLVAASLDQGPALVVGTGVGTVIAYDEHGRRYWTSQLNPTPSRPVLSVSAATTARPELQPVSLGVVLAQEAGSGEPSDVVLLDNAGRRLEPPYLASDAAGLSRLVDINKDGRSELLLAGFATLELLDPGIGARQYFEAWDYRLGAEPQAILVDDIDLDGEQELLVGTHDGKLHALENNGSALWVSDLGGVVSNIALAPNTVDSLPDIVTVHNDVSLSEDGTESIEGWVEVLRPDGRTIWRRPFPTTVSSLLVADINRSGRPEILVGTGDGQLIALSTTNEEFWDTPVGATVEHLELISDVRSDEILVSTGANTVDRYNHKGTSFVRIAEYLEDIAGIDLITSDDLQPMIMIALEDGMLRTVNPRGVQLAEVPLDGIPSITLPAGNSLLVGTDEEVLERVDLNGSGLWRLSNLGRITSLYWGDLDGDVQSDVAVGNRAGEVILISGDGLNTWDRLNLGSEVLHISAFRRSPYQQAELIAVTDNGVVQLFKSLANRPPLLINPQTEVSQGRYSIAVSVVDVEQDPVNVNLEIYDPDLQSWQDLGQRTADDGNDTLFWPVDPPDDVTEVRYRLRYDDGSHQGQLEPAPGPVAIRPSPLLSNLAIGLITLLAGSGAAVFYLRQSRSPAAQVRSYFQKVRQRPEEALQLLSEHYAQTAGSPDFLLNLASRARRENDQVLASLADGLFLLPSRPESALPIIVGALEEGEKLRPSWKGLDDWQLIFGTGLALNSAPTITELSLLRPRLEQMITALVRSGRQIAMFEELMQVLTTLRDGERVDLAEDRLVYLNEASDLLTHLDQTPTQALARVETVLASSLVDRWLGLVRAEIEELQGKAQLMVSLLTRHVIPEAEVVVALKLVNNGRAAAESIFINLEDDPSYIKISQPQLIPLLPPGRQRQVQFIIEPQVRERFRVVFSIVYNDRTGKQKRLAFADMVHLLPPAGEFEPIPNPYSPGMPLRRDSLVFFGREDLFDFVRENAGRTSQQNVLILVGQRRTGKTSALLQLDRHLPDKLFPIYIDCQSLGVVPGMPALFYDLAWIISDALGEKGYELEVPEPTGWQDDPAGRFQRQFIPAALALLPFGTKMLLVFDEFEAFENLVNDGILPATLFTYLRHLMQHGKGLSFIFAGTHRLEEMGTDYWSVLFNIALYRQVGFLSNDAARRLIRDPVVPQLVYDDLAVDKILRVTAGHPYFLQLVCYTLVSRANQLRSTYVTISDVNAGLDEMLRLGEVHFAYLWQRASHTERALLSAAARLVDFESPFRPADLVQYLNQYSIYLDPSEVTAGLSRLVEQEILREVADEGTPLYEVRIGLVGLWVNQNKSLSRLYEKAKVPQIAR